MSKIKIYHNPRCSKSRATYEFLKEKDVDIDVVEYLKTPPTIEELKGILKKLDTTPRELMRTKEAIYKELNLKDESDDEKLILAMVENPKLIERPIVIKGDKAAIGRPIENIQKLLES